MQLNRFTDYSIRVLLYASVNREQLITMASVAAFYHVSVEHMRKVVHNLAKLNYIKTYKGKNGGFELACDPTEINLGHVIREIEGLTPLINCEKEECRLNPQCTLKGILREAQMAFISSLEQYTLADLVTDQFMQKSLNIQLIQKS
ncbi:Rrf2 family transcriptional regulator [Endozoicomonas sp. SM1973]|uniref:Rrf2 family transcriptional regulator n=1 Tax=Spartinivicinus marinus TaxID=2994442 RepID=A0A853I7Z8_9GAMM|nr:Rrf2 family transcriptional regulator [Spartinivicinus marinus]MCX4027766.1 Rrf2 family transcriptional regulator [Spartinivicinus marinus]NYZ68949.1 Rrf2 family transcriptional regulator [Spartinivicinus marinus]